MITLKPYLIALMEFLVAKRYAVLVWAGPDVSADGKTVARVEHFHLTKPAGYNPGSFGSSAFAEIDQGFSSTAWGGNPALASIPWTNPQLVGNSETVTIQLEPVMEGKSAKEEIAKEEEPADILTSAEKPLAEGEEPVEMEGSAEEVTEEEVTEKEVIREKEPVEQVEVAQGRPRRRRTTRRCQRRSSISGTPLLLLLSPILSGNSRFEERTGEAGQLVAILYSSCWYSSHLGSFLF